MGKFEQAFSPGDVMRRLHELERQVEELTAGRRLEDASVGAGGLRVHSGGGVRVHQGGDVRVEDGGDVEVEGGDIRVRDSAGTVMLEVGGDLLGISRPWIPLRIAQHVDRGQFWQDVTSDTFKSAADACGFLQHGHVIMIVNHLVDAGTTAEFRFVITDKQGEVFTTGALTVVGDGTHLQFGRTIGVDPTFEVAAPESGNCVTLEGRRVSGTGQVRTNLGMAYGTGRDGNPYPILGSTGGGTAGGTSPPGGSEPPPGGGGAADHGELTGLADDDHTQYLDTVRGDARYYTQSAVDTALAGKSDTGHLHDGRYYTETEVDALLDDKSDVGHSHLNIDYGYHVGTTDGSGFLTIPHSLGVVPTTTIVTPDNPSAGLTYVAAEQSSATASDFKVLCRDVRDGAILTNNGTNVHWLVIA